MHSGLVGLPSNTPGKHEGCCDWLTDVRVGSDISGSGPGACGLVHNRGGWWDKELPHPLSKSSSANGGCGPLCSPNEDNDSPEHSSSVTRLRSREPGTQRHTGRRYGSVMISPEHEVESKEW